jgi:hypothetical protein
MDFLVDGDPNSTSEGEVKKIFLIHFHEEEMILFHILVLQHA